MIKSESSQCDGTRGVFGRLIKTSKKSKCDMLQAYMSVRLSEIVDYTSVRCDNWNLSFGKNESCPKERLNELNNKHAAPQVEPKWCIPPGFITEIAHIIRCFNVTSVFYAPGDGWKQEPCPHTPPHEQECANQPKRATFRFRASVVWKDEIACYGKDARIEPCDDHLVLVFTLYNSRYVKPEIKRRSTDND